MNTIETSQTVSYNRFADIVEKLTVHSVVRSFLLSANEQKLTESLLDRNLKGMPLSLMATYENVKGILEKLSLHKKESNDKLYLIIHHFDEANWEMRNLAYQYLFQGIENTQIILIVEDFSIVDSAIANKLIQLRLS